MKTIKKDLERSKHKDEPILFDGIHPRLYSLPHRMLSIGNDTFPLFIFFIINVKYFFHRTKNRHQIKTLKLSVVFGFGLEFNAYKSCCYGNAIRWVVCLIEELPFWIIIFDMKHYTIQLFRSIGNAQTIRKDSMNYLNDTTNHGHHAGSLNLC